MEKKKAVKKTKKQKTVKSAAKKKQQKTLKMDYTEIRLQPNQSAIVIADDGSSDLYIAGPKDGDFASIISPSAYMAAGIAVLISHKYDLLMDLIDDIMETAEVFEETKN